MNNEKLILAIDDLKNEILKDPVVSRFLELADEIRSSKELQKLEKDIVSAKKGMALNMADDKKYLKYKEDYDYLLALRASNPLIINYESYKCEVKALLTQIKDVLDLEK
jgi:hypothetical protein